MYLLGNPIIWWGNLALLAFFLFVYAIDAIRAQRSGEQQSNNNSNQKGEGYLTSGLWLLTGWGLHYIPFWAMGRVLYFHHYFPALLFSNMLSAIVIDYCVVTMNNILPDNLSRVFKHTVVGGILAALCYSFLLFSPLAYGMDETPGHMANSSVHHLKWMSSWEF